MSLIIFKKKRIVEAIAELLFNYDPYWDNVSLLLHGSGTNNSVAFVDSSSHNNTVTYVGSPKITTLDNKFNGSCIEIPNQASDILRFPTTNNKISSFPGDFTIEFWHKYVSGSIDGTIFLVYNGSAYLAINSTNSAFNIYLNSALPTLANVGSVVPGTWQHIALCRSGSTVRLFVDGIMVTSTTNSSTLGYTAATLIQLGGAGPGNVATRRIDEVRITNGICRYTENFNVPTTAFPHQINLNYDWFWDKTVLAVKGGNNGLYDKTFEDASSNKYVLTTVGDVKQSMISPYLNNSTTGAIYFDGNGDYINPPTSNNWAFGTGDFTIEFWARPTSFYNYISMVSTRTGVNTTSWTVATQGDRNLVFYAGSELLRDPQTMETNTWYHIAIVRSNGVLTGYKNGIQFGSVTNTYNFTSENLRIGVDLSFGENYTGHLSDLRIVKGQALYTAAFDVPTEPLTPVPNTVLLLNCENTGVSSNNKTIIDSSTNNLTVTPFGNVTQGSVSPFNGVGGSMRLNGSTDYITLPGTTVATPSLTLGTSDFTIETWVNITGINLQTADNSYHWPLCFWGNWFAGSQPINFALYYVESSYGITGGFWEFCYNDATKYKRFNMSSGVKITRNAWHHVALVRTGNSLNLYVDGLRVGATADCTGMNLNQTSVGRPLTLGRQYGGGTGNVIWSAPGYISNFSISKTAKYLNEFAVSTSPLVPDSNTALLLKFESAGIVDETGNHNLELVGNSSLSTNVKKYGVGSMYFDGAGDYVTFPTIGSEINFGTTQDFTLECWFNIVGNSALDNNNQRTARLVHAQSGNFDFNLMGNSTTTGTALEVYVGVGKSFMPTYNFSKNTWYHVAFVRQTSTLTIYVNGKSIGSTAYGHQVGADTTTIYLGGIPTGNYTRFFNGYIDDLRITKGVARYTRNFTPLEREFGSRPPIGTELNPTTYDPYWQQTILAMPLSSDLTDKIGSSVTNNGVVLLGTPAKFGLTSATFNGIGSHLVIPANAKFNLAAQDFTIETWCYFKSAARQYIFNAGNSAVTHYNIGIDYCHLPGMLGIWASSNGSAWDIAAGIGVAAELNTWYHIALVRYDSSWKFYLNGVEVTSITSSLSISDISAKQLNIGRSAHDGAFYLNGNLQDFRIIKGVAKYTENFTPSNTPMLTNGASF